MSRVEKLRKSKKGNENNQKRIMVLQVTTESIPRVRHDSQQFFKKNLKCMY